MDLNMLPAWNIKELNSVFEQNLLTSAVVKFRGSAVGVAVFSLIGFERAVIFQKIRDAGRAE
jgi:hypothetical protein